MLAQIGRRTLTKAVGAAALVGLASDSVGASTGTLNDEHDGDGDTSEDDDTTEENRHGPVRKSRFAVEIGDIELEGWESVSLPSVTVEEGEYREGDDPDYEKNLWGQTAFDDLQMERQVRPTDNELWEWLREVREGGVDTGRKEVTVELLGEEGEARVKWQFSEAWVKEYDPPELDASADGDVATESITVAFDKMEREEI